MQLQEAFKDMAKVLRWRVLANGHHTVREADLILGGESLMKLISLMWESRRPLTLFVCTAWVSRPSPWCPHWTWCLCAQYLNATVELTH